jgi:SPFH domain / Band 7 family
MKNFFKIFVLVLALFSLQACTRIETGTVGLRVDMSKQIQGTELQAGSWNQTLVGSVLEFQVRSIPTGWDNLTPQTADNSTLKEFDVSIVYEINPASVSELWTTQSRSFHTYEHGDYLLMRNYMSQVLSSAAAKAVRKYKALDVADNRQNIEKNIHDIIVEMLVEEKLEKAITVSQVRVTAAVPADDIVASANAAVRAQNDLKTKQVEVQIAQQEAIRIQTLNSNSQAIPYMNAMAQMEIAKAVREGRVHTIIIPQDFKGMVNVGK